MKWNLKPLSFAKQTAAGLSIVTMCISPLAHGAQAKAMNKERINMSQKELISQYLRTTNLTSKKSITAGEYWKMVRPVYPAKFQRYMDAWIIENRHTPMPTIDATAVKGADGEQVRLLFTDKENRTLTANFTGDMDRFVKINSVMLSKKELMDVNNFPALLAKLAKQDASLKKLIDVKPPKLTWGKDSVLNISEYKKLTARQKIEYHIRLRRAVETAQNIFKATYGKQAFEEIQKKHEYAIRFLFGFDAEAKVKAKKSDLNGSICIVAGWKSIYGENGSCGGNDSGWADVQGQMSAGQANCSGGGLACNPMVYGFDTGGGAFCMSRSEAKYATKACNVKSPLDRDADDNMLSMEQYAKNKKKIVESYMKKVKGETVNLTLDAQGNITPDQQSQIQGYLDDLGNYIGSAVDQCGVSPLAETQTVRPDQKSACDEIRIRAFSLKGFPEAPAPDLGGRNCDEEKPGSMLEGNDCVCAEGEKQEGEIKTCVIGGDLNEGPVEKKKKKGGSLLPILGILAVVGIGAYLIFKNKGDDKKDNPYIPPAPVSPTVTPTTPVVEPTIAPCPEPNVIVNGVCVPPVVVQPDSEGGTKVDPDDKGTGVR